MPAYIPIASREDERIEAYRDIRERDLVGRARRFIAEGEVVLRVLLAGSRHRVLSLLLAEKRVETLRAEIDRLPPDVAVFVAPQAVMDGIAGFPIHRGMLALGERAAEQAAAAAIAALPGRAIVLALFGIANHDNMGGLFRNAAAFGVRLVLLDGDCCDPLYRKAIRVSAGNVLSVPFARLAPGEDALGLLEKHGFASVAFSPKGEKTLAGTRRADRVAVLVGAEGPGLPEEILVRSTTIRIPMAPGVDSLNVATASGIALHHFAAGENG